MKSKDELLDELTSKVYFLTLKVERQAKRIAKLEEASGLTPSTLLAAYGVGDELPETD